MLAVIWFVLRLTKAAKRERSPKSPAQPQPRPASPAPEVSTPAPAVSESSKVRALTIELAMYMVVVSGSIDRARLEAIRRWAEKVKSEVPGAEAEAAKLELNTAIKGSYEKAGLGAIVLNTICASLSEMATEHQKDEAFRLCLDVASAAGSPGKPELGKLERIVSLLGLDRASYRGMLGAEKPAGRPTFKPGRPRESVISREAQELMSELGIGAGPSKEKTKKRLTTVYRKCNSRVNHPEAKKRKRADQMLLLVGELRQHLLG